MNLTNEQIKNLKDKKYRKELGLFMVEGEKFCKDLIKYDVEIVYTLTSKKDLSGLPNICIVSDKIIKSLATTVTCQDIICFCKRKELKIDSIGNSLILDNLQDPGNVGTLIRSALAFGFDDIYLVDGVDVYNEKVIRSSAGIILSARIHTSSFEEIKANKTKIADVFLVADMQGENINKIHLEKTKIAVIIGNEGAGVSDEFISLADIVVSIPMAKKIESLNAGVAGSIIMQKLGEIK